MTKRDINSIRIICAYGEERGIDSVDLLEGTEIHPDQLDDNQIQTDEQQELIVLQNLIDGLGDPFRLGVDLGKRYQLTTYGIVGYALLASETVRKATVLGIRYLGLTYAYSDIQLTESDEDFILSFKTAIPGDLGVLVLVRDLWAVSLIYQELLGLKQFPLMLHLAYPESCLSDETRLASLETSIGATILFDAKETAYHGQLQLLDLPLPRGNALTARLCEEQCRELLKQKQNWKAVSQKVQDILLREGLNTSMEQVAAKLARTTRTLHRQLKDELTSWRQVRDQVRMGLAEELLAQPIQLEEIAERLGYSEAANFSHSFKRCQGCSPREFRKRLVSRS